MQKYLQGSFEINSVKVCFEHILRTIYMHLIQLMPYTVVSINIFPGGTTIVTPSASATIINQSNPSTLN